MYLFPEMPNTIDLALSNRKKISGYKRSVKANFCYVSDKIKKDYWQIYAKKRKTVSQNKSCGTNKGPPDITMTKYFQICSFTGTLFFSQC